MILFIKEKYDFETFEQNIILASYVPIIPKNYPNLWRVFWSINRIFLKSNCTAIPKQCYAKIDGFEHIYKNKIF